MTRDEKLQVAFLIHDAFIEGYHSYATPCAAYNSSAGAWEDSEAKIAHDKLIEEANNEK
jgi:hypothetical protein